MTVPSGELDRGETSEAIGGSFTMLFEMIVGGGNPLSLSATPYISACGFSILESRTG